MDERAGVLDRRLEALFIDGLLMAIVVGILGFAGGTVFLGQSASGMIGMIIALQFVAFPALLVYQIALEGYYGMTIGKYLRGIVVVQSDGSSITWPASVVRNVLRLLDGLPAFYVLGIIVAYATDDHQRIGDIAGDTVVVHTQN